jgi:opacity protein-like surface antigen
MVKPGFLSRGGTARSIAFLAAGALLSAVPVEAQAPEDRLHFSFGLGLTVPNSEVREPLGSGYNVTLGIQYDVTPIIGVEAFLSTNSFGDETVSIPVSPSEDSPAVPSDFFLRMTMQMATANLVVQRPEGSVTPYGLAGMGVYRRPVRVSTNAVGWVPGYCNPYWYVCYPGVLVPVENIAVERSSTDFGMQFGGGLNFGFLFAEARYHYIWGPTIEPTQVNPLADLPSSLEANGQFFAATVGVRF